jgi:hypothetical protein
VAEGGERSGRQAGNLEHDGVSPLCPLYAWRRALG